jgi:O-antigen ligase
MGYHLVVMPEIVRYRLTQIVLWTGILATTMIAPFSNYDPISLPKLAVISFGSISALFLLILYRKSFINSHKSIVLLLSGFVFWMLLVLLFSGAPLEQQIWGMFGRNTGLLAYFSLASLMLASCISSSDNYDFARRLSNSVIGVSIFETLYCLVQIAKRDPIRWSEMQPFGTLGNVNFLSAFLGISTVIILNQVVGKDTRSLWRFALTGLLIVQLYVIEFTGSIQGLMMFAVGSAVSILFRIASSRYAKFAIPSVVSGFSVVGIISAFALFNKGPLASFIYQPSIVFRWDYMHAGIEMTQQFPVFGVGLDSYGDWYRQLRGEISTLRTGPDRVSNSAHNIFLDISSNGGLPLILIYLALVIWASIGCYRLWIRSKTIFNPWHAALVASWIAYQVQALISINQLGVGVWAWILTGTLISFSSSKFQNIESSVASLRTNTDNKKTFNKSKDVSAARRKLKGELMPAKASLVAFSGAAIGMALCLPALVSDSAVYRAFQTGDTLKMVNSLKGVGVTAWHMEVVLDDTVKKNDAGLASEVISILKAKFPRDYYAYYIEYMNATASQSDRNAALTVLKTLDPFNPNI